jgi:hypothetical protein
LFIEVSPFFNKQYNYAIAPDYEETDLTSYTYLTNAGASMDPSQDTGTKFMDVDPNYPNRLNIVPTIYFNGYPSTSGTSEIDDFYFNDLGNEVLPPTTLDDVAYPKALFQVDPNTLKDITYLVDNAFIFQGENRAQHNKATIYFSNITRAEYLKIIAPESFNVIVDPADVDTGTPAKVIVSYYYPQSFNPNYPIPKYDSKNLDSDI